MKTDVAIIGAGPGGVASALFLAQRGISSAIIEKDEFPRFHIGESLTGECGNCLRMLDLGQEMVEAKHPVKWGVTVYGPEGKNSFWIPVMARSPEKGLTEASTWQVRRSTFDNMFLDHARQRGADYIRGEVVDLIRNSQNDIAGLKIKDDSGAMQDIESKVVVDASGMATALCHLGATGKKDRGNYDKQVAIFSHLKGTLRKPAGDQEDKHKDNTLIFYQSKDHWAWYIPLDQDVVSIGIVTPTEYFSSKGESKHDFFMREIKELNSELADRVEDASLVEEVRGASNYSYHIKDFTGKNFLCVGDAHRFIDPVFSFGLYFSIKEAQFAAEAIDGFLKGKNADAENPFADYQHHCEGGMDVIQEVLDCFWNHPMAFSVMAHTRYHEDFIDLFAGRVYLDEEPAGLKAIRAINQRGEQAVTA